MDKKKSGDILYYSKICLDEGAKKKNKKNLNYQKSNHKSNQKTFFPKKPKNEPNNNEKYNSKKNSVKINEDSSPTKETINSPSKNKNNTNEKNKKKINNNIKETPQKRNIKNKSKKIKCNTCESELKVDNEDDLVTSFERKPSELKSPETVSEDSFTSSYEEEKSKEYKKEFNTKREKSNYKEIIKKDSNTYSELVENELIYVDKINNNKDDDEEEEDEEEEEENIVEKEKSKKKMINEQKNIIKKKQINNKIPELDLKEKVLKEKELKDKERDKKNEKFRNMEIKTKITVRPTAFISNSNSNIKNSKSNSKIIVKKSPREFIMKTEREVSSSNLNNIKKISNKNLEGNIPYIPVNQRKKLTVNKKLIDSYKIKDLTKTNSLNFLENEALCTENNIKKNAKDKIFLSNFKKNGKKFFGPIKNNNTEEKNRYRKIYINDNCTKNYYFNTNMNKLNLDNIRNNKDNTNNKKLKGLKHDYENKLFNNISISHTIEVSNDFHNSQRRNKNEKELTNDKENYTKFTKENNELYPKKSTVLLAKKTNNKSGLNFDDLKLNKNKPLNNNLTTKTYSYNNSNKIIYEPKKLGVIRVRSTKKMGQTQMYSNMSYDPNQYLNNKIKNELYSGNSNNKNNLNNSLNILKNDKININNEESLMKKNSENIQKKFIELNNTLGGNDSINQAYNIVLLNNTMANGLKNLNNFNSILNSSYEIGKIENCRNNNYLNGLNKQLSNNSLLLSKMTEKTNSASNLTNILNPNERYSLNNYYEGEKPNNNAALNNFQHNLFHHNNTYELGLNGQMKNLNNRTQLINLIGNNFLGPNIVQNNPSNNINNSIGNINNFNLKNIFPNNDTVNNNFEQNTNSFSINFEDLIILQEYLREIIILINKNKVIENECFEFWNYYYNSSLCCQLEKLFTNPLDSNAVRISINYTLMSIMICYDYSFELDLLNKIYTTLSDILKLNYKNLILICEHILSRITKESLSNIWVLKLSTIVNASNYNDYNQFLMNGYNMTIVERISYNTNIIVQNLRFLLKNFQSTKNNILTSMFKKIREKTYEEINTFFREKILRITNINGSILGSVFLLQNNNFRTLPSPYVRTKNNKEFSLVLDLDETLINFKPRNNGEEGGILRIRPGINEFLDEVGKYYELIIFTTATQDYADALIDEVEDNKIYFDHRLYREHAVIIDNDFVKDLTRIGRPLDKIIIVDNMPQNFRLQKENGIIIKAFWGEDDHDTALLDLYPILVNIAKEGGDVRKSLVKYKDEIVKNVTSCISKSDNI